MMIYTRRGKAWKSGHYATLLYLTEYDLPNSNQHRSAEKITSTSANLLFV